MKASQGCSSRWFSHLTRILVGCCGVLLLLSACVPLPSLATSTPTANPPTPSEIPTVNPPTSTVEIPPSPTATNTAIPTQLATPTPTEMKACTETEGQMVAGEFESQLLEEIFNFEVYLPACYGSNPELRYPVVYLLHGLYTDEMQWDLIGLADTMDRFVVANGKPFIVVMPRIPNNNAQAKSPIHQVIPEELVTYIDKNYPTLADRDHRAIGGLSRGASLALRIGYDRRDLFGKVGMHSLPMLVEESTSYAKALGNLELAERPMLFLDSGNDDRDLLMARTFDLELTKLAIPHTWYMFNGYHEEAYWSEHLPIYLEWYAQDW